MAQVLEFDIHERIATLTLNRPAESNAFNMEMINLWTQALEQCIDNEAVRTVVVTGAGKAFCSGGDLRGLGSETGQRPENQVVGGHTGDTQGVAPPGQAGYRRGQWCSHRCRHGHGALVRPALRRRQRALRLHLH